MPSQPDPHKEKPSTYFVQNRHDVDERTRVTLQDIMITQAMGGVLPEQTDSMISELRRVIDIGCGTGGWLVDMAKTHPYISLLVGIDISSRMIKIASDLAREEHVDDHVEFHTMDVLRNIEFPKHYFDLLNQRLGFSYLRTWDWPKLLARYQEITRPGGVVRVTEGYVLGTSTSPALTQLDELTRLAFYNAGHLFTHTRDGVTNRLPDLFRRYGFKDVQSRTSLVAYSSEDGTMDSFFANIKIFYRTVQPFLNKWAHMPDNYDELYQQALHELQRPGGHAAWEIVTIWGTNS